VNPVTSTGCTSVDIGVSASLELVDKFCYLGDMLSVGEGLRERLGLHDIISVLQQNRLRWYGHVL